MKFKHDFIKSETSVFESFETDVFSFINEEFKEKMMSFIEKKKNNSFLNLKYKKSLKVKGLSSFLKK